MLLDLLEDKVGQSADQTFQTFGSDQELIEKVQQGITHKNYMHKVQDKVKIEQFLG